jgi:hypothetical protein
VLRQNTHAVCLGAAVRQSLAGKISQPAGRLATKRTLLHLSLGDPMSFVIAGLLGTFSGVLYLASERQAFASVCRYTVDLCQHPSWPLFVAALVAAFGILFQVQKS